MRREKIEDLKNKYEDIERKHRKREREGERERERERKRERVLGIYYLYLINTWFVIGGISLFWFYKDHTFNSVLLQLKSHRYCHARILLQSYKTKLHFQLC